MVCSPMDKACDGDHRIVCRGGYRLSLIVAKDQGVEGATPGGNAPSTRAAALSRAA